MSATSPGPHDPRSESDPYSDWDAAYVLGALSGAERLEFEDHLAGCSGCGAAVAELAVLPGLLGQVGPEDAARLAEGAPAERPAGARTRPPRTGPRGGGRLTRAVVGLAAALALVLGGLGLGQLVAARRDQAPEQLAFAALEPSEITANVRLVPVTGGTQVEVECQYSGAGGPDEQGHGSRYSVVVIDGAGHAVRVKDWDVKPDRVMRPSGTTALALRQIRDVEIWDAATQEPVLRATRG